MLVERISSGIEGLDSGRLLIINTINNLLSGSKAMVEKVNLQRAFAVVIYKKLIVTGQVTKEMDVGARLAVINKTLDIVREKINIDADIMKNALMENDKISFVVTTGAFDLLIVIGLFNPRRNDKSSISFGFISFATT